MTNEVETPKSSSDSNFEKEILAKLAFASVNEQRRTRRWNIFFKATFVAYLFIILFMIYLPGDKASIKPVGEHTGLVDIEGVIAAGAEANADTIVTGLRKAFENKNTKAVILRINSPGGSPVQSGYINDEIIRLRKKYPDKKLYAVISDVCASGGYYIAAAADEIYADKASVVGSIGVLMNGFGFVESMKKLGVERRLYTAGESKGFLDPFSEEKQEDIRHIKELLKTIHDQFIAVVKQGRGDRLKDDPKLFTGLVWTGEESIELGLVDGLGSSGYVAREIIKADKIVNYTPTQDLFERFAERLGSSAGAAMLEAFKSTAPQLK